MDTNTDSRKLLVKNSIVLYLRMTLTIVIGLYTSRIVLDVLGVDDYGVYNIVGGIVGLTSFLNNSMSSATSRFLTFELGNGNKQRMSETFGGAFTIHLGLAILIVFICETFGVWFVNNHLVLPEDSMRAANWVFQMSIFSMVLTILQVPFNASIIAHEKMNMFAFVEILHVSLKLVIVYLLIVIPYNKLEIYSTLLLVVSLVTALCYYLYCRKNFAECRITIVRDKTILKPMFAYSGWDMFGNLSSTAKQQGCSIVMNWFYGVLANASAGIANIVSGTISGFSQVIMTAFRPRIIKYYAAGQLKDFFGLMSIALRIGTVFYLMIVIPVYLCIDDFLDLWLKNPPQYSGEFCKIMIISGLFNMVTVVFIAGIHATGKIRNMTLTGFVCNLMSLVVGYIGYRMGAAVGWIYWSFCISNAIIAISVIAILKQQIKDLNLLRLQYDILRVFLCGLVISGCCYFASSLVNGQLAVIMTVSSVSMVSSAITSYIFLLDKYQRGKAREIIYSKLHLKI